MKERRDRRVAFFLVAAIMCFLLVPVCDSDYRWVAELTGTVYVLLAGASALDARTRRRH